MRFKPFFQALHRFSEGSTSGGAGPAHRRTSVRHFVSEATMAWQKAGSSSGKRDVIKYPSTTQSLSSQSAPALMQSSQTLAYDVLYRPFTRPALIVSNPA